MAVSTLRCTRIYDPLLWDDHHGQDRTGSLYSLATKLFPEVQSTDELQRPGIPAEMPTESHAALAARSKNKDEADERCTVHKQEPQDS